MPLSNKEKAALSVVLNHPASHDPHRNPEAYLAELLDIAYEDAQKIMDTAEKDGYVYKTYHLGHAGKLALQRALYALLKDKN